MNPTLRARHAYKSVGSQWAGHGLHSPKELDAFFRSCNAVLIRVCARWTRGNREDAQDLLAEAYLKAVFAAERGLLPARNPIAWLSSIIANLARDEQRARNRRAGAIGDDYLETVRDPQCGSDTLLATRELLSETLAHVAALGRMQRAALLARSGGESYEAIAAQLGTSVANARKLVQTARSELRGRISPLELS